MAVHIGTVPRNTSTSAHASAMKTAPKMYFSTARSFVQLPDALREIGDALVERHAQTNEDGDGERAHTEPHPQQRVAAAAPQLRPPARDAPPTQPARPHHPPPQLPPQHPHH